MHSSISRVQNVLSFFTSIAFTIGIAVAFSTLLFPSNPTASVKIRHVNVRTGRQHAYATKSQEFAIISFDLTADLTSLFNYNTKQVFAYLSVSYNDPSPDHVNSTSKWSDNDAIIWDVIIPDASQAKLNVPKEQATYKINDISGKFHERDAIIRLAWNVQPHIGALYWGEIVAPLEHVKRKELDEDEAGGYGNPDDWEFKFPPPWKRKTANTATMKEEATAAPAA